jgi:hypothetical protein
MTYSFFVSHTGMDTELAEALTRHLRESFGERIRLHFAREDIEIGEQWKGWIQENLERCNGVLSIFTPESIDKPWLYVEWAPFWLRGKDFIVLLAGGVQHEALIEPLRAVQAVDLENDDSVRNLFRTIAKKAGLELDEARLHGDASDLLTAVAAAREADLARSIERYADATVELPAEPREKRRILEYFCTRGAVDVVRDRFRTLDDDAFKADLALWVCRKNKVELAATLCEEIGSSEHLRRVAFGMVNAGHVESPEVRRVIERATSDAELRRLALDLLDDGRGDSTLIAFIIAKMTNTAELRRIAMRLIERSEFQKPIFRAVVEKLLKKNPVSVREIMVELLRQGLQRGDEFAWIIDYLVREKPVVAVPVLEEIKEADPDMLPLLYERHAHLGAGNAAVAWLRKELGRE